MFPFTHPFGFDWEFFVVPDPQYESLLAPSNTGKSSNGVVTDPEYCDATTHAHDTLGLQAPKGVLGVETDQGLVPEPFPFSLSPIVPASRCSAGGSSMAGMKTFTPKSIRHC